MKDRSPCHIGFSSLSLRCSPSLRVAAINVATVAGVPSAIHRQSPRLRLTACKFLMWLTNNTTRLEQLVFKTILTSPRNHPRQTFRLSRVGIQLQPIIKVPVTLRPVMAFPIYKWHRRPFTPPTERATSFRRTTIRRTVTSGSTHRDWQCPTLPEFARRRNTFHRITIVRLVMIREIRCNPAPQGRTTIEPNLVITSFKANRLFKVSSDQALRDRLSSRVNPIPISLHNPTSATSNKAPTSKLVGGIAKRQTAAMA